MNRKNNKISYYDSKKYSFIDLETIQCPTTRLKYNMNEYKRKPTNRYWKISPSIDLTITTYED